MYEYDREKDKLIIKLEAAEKAYMSLLYDYTELKEKEATMEKAFKEVRDLLDYIINHNYASKDSKEEGLKGHYEIQEGINRTPRTRAGEGSFYTYSTDYPDNIVLCRSVKLPVNDVSNDESAKWDDEDDGWENEKIRRTKCSKSCWRWSCKRTWSCRSIKWR